MNTERLIHMPQCFTINLSALCNSSNSIWKTIESHRWVKLSYENISMCLSYVPFTLVIRLINCWDFIQIWFDNKMLSPQWDNNNQHLLYIIVSWYLLGIITRQGFLFSCSCMNRCTCLFSSPFFSSLASPLFTQSSMWLIFAANTTLNKIDLISIFSYLFSKSSCCSPTSTWTPGTVTGSIWWSRTAPPPSTVGQTRSAPSCVTPYTASSGAPDPNIMLWFWSCQKHEKKIRTFPSPYTTVWVDSWFR